MKLHVQNVSEDGDDQINLLYIAQLNRSPSEKYNQ
jgi:hypothetical protein